MKYLMALWLVGQSVPVFIVGPNQIGDRVHAIPMSHEECRRGVHEATTLHPENVTKGDCIPAIPLPHSRPH